jgi:hypothetical protein
MKWFIPGAGDKLFYFFRLCEKSFMSVESSNKSDQKMSSDFDESLLEANIEMTVEERVLAHDAALEVAKEFEKAGEVIYGKAFQSLSASERSK